MLDVLDHVVISRECASTTIGWTHEMWPRPGILVRSKVPLQVCPKVEGSETSRNCADVSALVFAIDMITAMMRELLYLE
jgi:hypothetical protein